MGFEFELVVPCYNEARGLSTLIDRVVSRATEHGLSPQRFQLIIVENGSTDSSREELNALTKTRYAPWFTVISLPENQGYGSGVLAGLRATTAPIVGYTHADGQCDPEDALAAFKRAKESQEALLVKGRRVQRPWKARMFSWAFEWLARALVGVKVREINAQPKVFSRWLVNELQFAPPSLAFDLYLLYRAQMRGLRIEAIPVTFSPREHGLSSWSHSLRSRSQTIAAMVKYLWQLRRVEGAL